MDLIDVQHQTPSAAGHRLDGGAGQSRRTQVLKPSHQTGGQGLQAGLDENFLQERIPHLNGRTQLSICFKGAGRQPGSAVNTIAAGFGAHQQQNVAGGPG